MFKSLFIDLDGTILDGRLKHYECYRDILASHGSAPLDIDVYWKMKVSRLSVEEQLSNSHATIKKDEYSAEWSKIIENPGYLKFDVIHKGALDKLEQWKESGIKMYLITMRRNKVTLFDQLKQLDLLRYFEAIVTCNITSNGNAKAKAILDTVPDFKPTYTLFVGDTEDDLSAARDLGCKSWLLWCGLRNKRYLSSLNPDYLSSSIKDVNINETDENAHR